MTRFPPELQQRVARWCPVDEFLAMMLLNRASYLNLLASFYKIVVVDSTIQFNKLADTILTDRKLAGRTSSLRLLPLGLVVTIPYRYNAVAPDTSVVKKVLHALPNIKQLILKLSSSGLEELFQHGGLSDVPFKLQDFHCKLVTGIFDFLRHQTTLTFFNVLDGVPLNKEQMALISAEPNRMLPKVRKLTGHWSSVNVFIPDRPVSCLTVTHFGYKESPEVMASTIFRASAPLIEFMDVRFLPEASSFSGFVISWMNNLSRAHQSFEKFALCFKLPIIYVTGTPPSTLNIDADDISSTLQSFKSLRTIRIDVGPSCGPIAPPTLDEPRLMEFQFWKQACPSLRFVTLFGRVLCDE